VTHLGGQTHISAYTGRIETAFETKLRSREHKLRSDLASMLSESCWQAEGQRQS